MDDGEMGVPLWRNGNLHIGLHIPSPECSTFDENQGNRHRNDGVVKDFPTTRKVHVYNSGGKVK